MENRGRYLLWFLWIKKGGNLWWVVPMDFSDKK